MANQRTKKAALRAAHKIPKSPLEELPPYFQLSANDNLTTMVIGYWIQLAEFKEVPASKIAAARKRLAEIEEHRRLNPMSCKTPD